MTDEQQYALIVVSPDADGPGTYPVAVYGPDESREKLEQDGHALCDGSSGWTFVVTSWPLPVIQPAAFASA